ncbi:TonB-dependent receptor [Hyphococcus sp.]|uniref:TonB-dependent receptor n=1 Tax=Hyphococcus sp. TaxID=2038636 RepID=UPI003CCC3918
MPALVSRKNSYKNIASRTALGVVSLGACFSMLAMDAAIAQSDEIIVQATRRDTNIQNTPVAVTAINEKAVEGVVPRDLGDIAVLVPNFSASKVTGFNAASFAIRGAAQTDIIVYSESQVGVTIDDFYVPHVQTQLLDLFDIEQVEVLRGPQGTLFGKNTTAGVVNVRTKRPKLGVVEGAGRIQYGSYDRIETRLSLNIPLGDVFAFRFAGLYQKSDGYYRNGAEYGPVTTFGPFDGMMNNINAFEGATGQGDGSRLGGEDVKSMRAKLLFEPSDQFSALAQFELLRDDSDSVPAVNETPVGGPFVFNFLGLTQDPGDPLDNAGITNRDDANLFMSDGHQVDVEGYYLNIDWRPTDSVSIKSITGLRNQDSQLPSTYTGEVGPVSLFDANRVDERETFQQELRLNWTINPQLDLVAGGFYQNQEVTFCVTQVLGFLELFGLTDGMGNPFPTGTFENGPQVLCNAQDSKAYALFGDLTYALSDRLTLAGGFRYTWEEKDWIGRNQRVYQALDGGFDPSLNTMTLGPLDAADFDRFSDGVLESSGTWEEPAWRGTASYEWSDDFYTYFTAARGFRSGAFNDQSGTTGNPLTPAGIAPTDPEIATSYEVGFKSDWFDNTFRLNVTGFLVKYKDAQRQIAATLTNSLGQQFQETRFFNAADVEVKGIEVEGGWSTPIEGLQINGNFSWQDGEYNTFEADTDFDGMVDVDFSGRPLTRTPEITWTAQVLYETPLHNNKVLGFSFLAAHEDEQIYNYSDLGSQFDTTLNERTILNATVELSDADDRWFARVFAKNLTDKRYRVSTQPVADLWVFSQYGEPRVFGAEVGFNFSSE